MTSEPKIEQASPGSKLAPSETYRILILDTVEHIDQLKHACKDAGHSVVSALTIAEAFAFLEGKDNADLIVCAAYLEDESLFDFLNQLRTNQTHKNTMFLILALEPGPIGAIANETTKKAGRLLGADAFLSMPMFDAALLIREIGKLLPVIPVLEQNKRSDENLAARR